MIFNSLEFILFIVPVFIVYWFMLARNLKAQNLFLIAASYLFYGWWDYRFLSLIILSTIVDYLLALRIEIEPIKENKKKFLAVSLLVNLGLLGVFKYFNFFSDSFSTLLRSFGLDADPMLLNIILPVGISFYTFQTLSYTIDVYRGKIPASKSIIQFGAYVSFFPQLVAGPIERAAHFLPQFGKPRAFEYRQAVDGMRQILWGLFKKVVIADNCAFFVNEIFGNYEAYNTPFLCLGAVLFAFQIYGDFSGYSDIAIGLGRLFGFSLRQNFAFPYFSRDIAEFWRRWHISLSSWFKDYLYIPLGGSRGSRWFVLRNVFIIFLVSGFWHGANWTFIAWGGLNALFFVPLYLFDRNRQNLDVIASDGLFPSLKELWNMILTFFLVCFAWIFFRAESIQHAYLYIKECFYIKHVNYNQLSRVLHQDSPIELWVLGIFILLMSAMEWIQRRELHGMAIMPKLAPVRYPIYLIVLLIIWYYFDNNQSEFIYFQF